MNTKLMLGASVLALLNTIVGFGEAGGYAAKGDDMTALVTGALVQTGPDGDNNTIAVRALPAGIEAAKEAAAGSAPAAAKVKRAAPVLSGIVTGIAIPETKKGGNKGKSIYDFENMPVGGAFFIAATAETPEPWKSLASTATSATRRYDETVTENGQPVMETVKIKGKEVTREKKRHTRVFTMREIKDGAPFGEQFKGVAGAGVFRTA